MQPPIIMALLVLVT